MMQEFRSPFTVPSPDYKKGPKHFGLMIYAPRTLFHLSLLIRTAKESNTLPACVYPESYNLRLFMVNVNRHLLDTHVSNFIVKRLCGRLTHVRL